MSAVPALEDSFLDLKAIQRAIPLSKTTIYGLIAEGKFPAPLKINGTRRSVWRASEINAWCACQGDEP